MNRWDVWVSFDWSMINASENIDSTRWMTVEWNKPLQLNHYNRIRKKRQTNSLGHCAVIMSTGKVYIYFIIVQLVLLANMVALICAGRRGSSSFSGGFGGSWRRYKKLSSSGSKSGNYRRPISASPMHTVLTESLAKNRNSHKYLLSKRLSSSSTSLAEQNYLRRIYNLPPNGLFYESTQVMPKTALYLPRIPPDDLGNYSA